MALRLVNSHCQAERNAALVIFPTPMWRTRSAHLVYNSSIVCTVFQCVPVCTRTTRQAQQAASREWSGVELREENSHRGGSGGAADVTAPTGGQQHVGRSDEQPAVSNHART